MHIVIRKSIPNTEEAATAPITEVIGTATCSDEAKALAASCPEVAGTVVLNLPIRDHVNLIKATILGKEHDLSTMIEMVTLYPRIVNTPASYIDAVEDRLVKGDDPLEMIDELIQLSISNWSVEK